MTGSLHRRRLLMLALLVVVAFAGLGYRLVDLQVTHHEEMAEKQRQNTQQTIMREPRRGDIRDVRGNLLATSRFVRTVFADPSIIGDHAPAFAHTLAPLLGADEGELLRKLRLRLWTNTLGQAQVDQYVVLKHKVDEELWARIEAALKDIAFGDESRLPKAQRQAWQQVRRLGVKAAAFKDQERVYPNGTHAAHVLGYVGTRERRTPEGPYLETFGMDGVERTMNSILAGVPGWRRVETDRKKRELVAFREQDVAARPGLDVVLTLDIGLQDIVETELAEAMVQHSPLSATAIMIRPRTGEILAMATLPTFDPGHREGKVDDRYRNRAIADVQEPGSTFKIVAIAGALSDGLVDLATPIDCENGLWIFAGRPLHDVHRYGVLNVAAVLAKSSNIGAAKVGVRMGNERLLGYVRGFGFGEATGIPLPGEVRGIVNPLRDWTKLSITRIPMGHEVAATPLQLTFAMGAIANGGRLMRPMLIHHIQDERGGMVSAYSPQAVRQVISEAAAREMVLALKAVATTNGTAPKARLEHYLVAGKTGTAEKYKPGRFYFSSFIGFFPADRPEICLGVFLDEPTGEHFGGAVAAPFFREMAERAANYLSIAPDVLLEAEAPAVPGHVSSATAPPSTAVGLVRRTE